MKRIILIPVLCIIMLAVLALPVRAVSVQEEQANALNTDELENALSDEAEDILGDMSVMDSIDIDSGIKKLIDGILDKTGGIFKRGLKSAAIMLAIAILCSIANAIYDGKHQNYVVLAAVLAVSAVAVSDVGSFIGLGISALDDLDTFSKILLATLTTAAAAGGAITSAAAKYAATVLFLNIIITAARNVIVPLIYAYIAASIGSAALGGEGLNGAANLIKWVTGAVITVIMLAFVTYLTLTGIISGTTDAMVAKVAKTAISTVLPVVGGIIADATDTVLAGASILRNVIGIFGMLAVAAICVIPFIKLGIHYLLYKVSSGLAAAISDSRISKLLSSLGTAFGMMMGVVGASALMVFLSVISVIKVVA